MYHAHALAPELGTSCGIGALLLAPLSALQIHAAYLVDVVESFRSLDSLTILRKCDLKTARLKASLVNWG